MQNIFFKNRDENMYQLTDRYIICSLFEVAIDIPNTMKLLQKFWELFFAPEGTLPLHYLNFWTALEWNER